jgi:hypothetical protein
MKSKFKCACGTTTRYTDKDAQKLVTKNIPKVNRGSRPNQKRN